MNNADDNNKVAADWFVRLRAADPQSEEFSEWLAWMDADPAHRRAFAGIQEAWNVAQDAMPAAALSALPMPSAHRPSTPRRWSALAASLILVVTALAGYQYWHKRSMVTEQRIATARGQHQLVTLADGSTVELGGLTAVSINFTSATRLIVADEGEAFYRVHRDPARPFVVRAGNISVTAVGTAFSVRRESGTVSVTVQEGAVAIQTPDGAAPLRVAAGNQARLHASREDLPPSVSRSGAAAEWAPNKLRFEAEPLSVVVAALNRYSNREILLGDASLGTLQFSGTIFDDRIPQWVEGVQRLFPIHVRYIDARHVVLERARDTDLQSRP